MTTINMKLGDPGTLNLSLHRDRDFQETILFTDKETGNPLNFSGWTGKAQIKDGKVSGTLLEEFAVNIFGDQGKVVITLTDTETLAIALGPGEEAFWDLALTDGSGVRRPYLEGKVLMCETVTRE